MEISAASERDAVLPQKSSPSAAPNTPVAKKTRRALQQKQMEEKNMCTSELEDSVFMEATKTPKTATRITSETPRRSARKSVRPPLDYDDIIEKNLLASSSKERKGKTINSADQDEQAETNTHKWNAAEVGRHSRRSKRNRKSRKAANNAEKPDQEHITADEEEEKEVEKEKLEKLDEKTVKEDKNEVERKQKNQFELDENVQDKNEKKEEKQEDIINKEVESANSTDKSDVEVIQNQDQVIELSLRTTPDDIDMELIVGSPKSNQRSSPALSPQPNIHTNIDDMNELGLFPLSDDEQPNEADEMPSLILVDDGETENELNRTFDANDKALEDEPMPSLCVTEEQQVNDVHRQEDKEAEESCAASKKAPVYRFPTPYKCKSKENFQFTGDSSPTEFQLASSVDYLEVPQDRPRKRSKSISGSRPKTVSFYSPIETANVQDIDKRWESLNNSNITKRRKRSKSLDENRHQISRIPKPKPYPCPLTKPTVTPNKAKSRTKLPNFAAIHQKHFEKMENLEEHLERKAHRAKVLTNSAVKLQKQREQSGISSAKKVLPSTEIGRSRALKKIELSSTKSTPLKSEDVERLRRLPTPRKVVGVAQAKVVPPARVVPLVSNVQTKPAFNLSTKLFVPPTITSATHTQNVNEQSSKLEARRKRHMEMFKGRSGHEKRGEYVRGVRSNRRFELQMQHRRNLDENAG